MRRIVISRRWDALEVQLRDRCCSANLPRNKRKNSNKKKTQIKCLPFHPPHPHVSPLFHPLPTPTHAHTHTTRRTTPMPPSAAARVLGMAGNGENREEYEGVDQLCGQTCDLLMMTMMVMVVCLCRLNGVTHAFPFCLFLVVFLVQ